MVKQTRPYDKLFYSSINSKQRKGQTNACTHIYFEQYSYYLTVFQSLLKATFVVVVWNLLFNVNSWNVIDHIVKFSFWSKLMFFSEILCLQKLIDCKATKCRILKANPIIKCHTCSSNLLLKFGKNIQPIVHNNGFETGENFWTHCRLRFVQHSLCLQQNSYQSVFNKSFNKYNWKPKRN